MNLNKFYTFTLLQSVNKFHYGIYICAECKSQTIYMHNTGINLNYILARSNKYEVSLQYLQVQ
jgi:hypothetical protein